MKPNNNPSHTMQEPQQKPRSLLERMGLLNTELTVASIIVSVVSLAFGLMVGFISDHDRRFTFSLASLTLVSCCLLFIEWRLIDRIYETLKLASKEEAERRFTNKFLKYFLNLSINKELASLSHTTPEEKEADDVMSSLLRSLHESITKWTNKECSVSVKLIGNNEEKKLTGTTLARFTTNEERHNYNDPFPIDGCHYVFRDMAERDLRFMACRSIKDLDHQTQRIEHHPKAKDFCDSFAVAAIEYPLGEQELAKKAKAEQGCRFLGFLCVDSQVYKFVNDRERIVAKILLFYSDLFSEPLFLKAKKLSQRGSEKKQATTVPAPMAVMKKFLEDEKETGEDNDESSRPFKSPH